MSTAALDPEVRIGAAAVFSALSSGLEVRDHSWVILEGAQAEKLLPALAGVKVFESRRPLPLTPLFAYRRVSAHDIDVDGDIASAHDEQIPGRARHRARFRRRPRRPRRARAARGPERVPASRGVRRRPDRRAGPTLRVARPHADARACDPARRLERRPGCAPARVWAGSPARVRRRDSRRWGVAAGGVRIAPSVRLGDDSHGGDPCPTSWLVAGTRFGPSWLIPLDLEVLLASGLFAALLLHSRQAGCSGRGA